MDAAPATVGENSLDFLKLPNEILLCILSFLDEATIANLQLVSKKLRNLCLDDKVWKWRCFINRYRQTAEVIRGQPAANTPPHDLESPRCRAQFRQFRANWDLTYPGEKVSWYHEYIQRYGPTSTNWFENPVTRHGSVDRLNEVRGLALYCPGKVVHEYPSDPLFAVSPLEDGTVCLFDVKGTMAKRGGILGKSKPGLLFENSRAARSRNSRNIGITECVSVANQLNRAFFAVPGGLAEVDLERLEVVDFTNFEFSIMTLSSASPGVPLTVGTSLGLHLHDYRSPKSPVHDANDTVDIFSQIFGNKPLTPYAPLSQPSPLYILHVPEQGSEETVSHDIYVSGRFTNILRYDRRRWPHIVGSIHSGANTVSSLTSLPYRYSSTSERERKLGQISSARLASLKSDSLGGYTIVAGGEYATKGSLELYGVATRTNKAAIVTPHESYSTNTWTAMNMKESSLQNRQTISRAKVLSVINHGARLLLSDGNGELKWFERDGTTEVRRHRIGLSERVDEAEPTVFVRERHDGEFARKILSTQTAQCRDGVNNDDVMFWTGEKLGLVSFTSKPAFTAEDFEESKAKTEEELRQEAEEKVQRDLMRRALEKHADDVRLTRHFGLGLE